ncbi:MAG: hypothetical protein PHI63_05800 [Patescibacteria group bacterium]|nr:hypothetical protein [Patescibacteria group bacterium]
MKKAYERKGVGRACDLKVRNLALCPTELRARKEKKENDDFKTLLPAEGYNCS